MSGVVIKKKMQIAILLGTFNGAKYVEDQLDSFEDQSHTDWILWASDDGSTDNTISMVKAFASKVGGNRVHQVDGPKKGFAANFLSMVYNPDLKADAYAYSDQDDIWMKDKLERAAFFLGSVPANIPSLYCSRTLYVDENNRDLKTSNPYTKPATFNNAIVQNIASGNTMVFNNAARTILLKLGRDADVSLHDWITYIVVSGVGGQVYFDQNPTVRYRQHSGNLIGMNLGAKAALNRIVMLFRGRYKDWNDEHMLLLARIEDSLSDQSKNTLQKYLRFRKASLIQKLFWLNKIPVYRQTRMGNLGLALAAFFNKI